MGIVWELRRGERTVSRRHAVLTRDEAGVWWADDAGSAHGTYVNGRLVGERVPLGHGACVQAGDVLVTLRDVTGAATGAVPGRFEPTGWPSRCTACQWSARVVLRYGHTTHDPEAQASSALRKAP